MKNTIKKNIKLVGNIISILSLFFIALAIRELDVNFNFITNLPLFLAVTGVCIAIKSFTVFVMATAWADWLQFFGKCKFNPKLAICAYVKANIGKYLPGNVMHYVERNLFASELGISQKKMAVSSIIEVMGLTGIALLLSVLISFQYLKELFHQILGERYYFVPMIITICIIAALSILWIFHTKIKNLISDYSIKAFFCTFLIAIVKYAMALVGLGSIMAIIYTYMGGVFNWYTIILIISGYIIAWVVGFLIPGASGGIGVRELAITFLLGPLIGTEMVLTLSIIHRLITVIGDFVSYLISIIMRRRSVL